MFELEELVNFVVCCSGRFRLVCRQRSRCLRHRRGAAGPRTPGAAHSAQAGQARRHDQIVATGKTEQLMGLRARLRVALIWVSTNRAEMERSVDEIMLLMRERSAWLELAKTLIKD